MGAGVVVGFLLRVPLKAAEEVRSVSRSWEADPNRACSSFSADAENRGTVALRLLHDSQHSLL